MSAELNQTSPEFSRRGRKVFYCPYGALGHALHHRITVSGRFFFLDAPDSPVIVNVKPKNDIHAGAFGGKNPIIAYPLLYPSGIPMIAESAGSGAYGYADTAAHTAAASAAGSAGPSGTRFSGSGN